MKPLTLFKHRARCTVPHSWDPPSPLASQLRQVFMTHFLGTAAAQILQAKRLVGSSWAVRRWDCHAAGVAPHDRPLVLQQPLTPTEQLPWTKTWQGPADLGASIANDPCRCIQPLSFLRTEAGRGLLRMTRAVSSSLAWIVNCSRGIDCWYCGMSGIERCGTTLCVI